MASVSQFHSYLAACQTAQAADDYAAAVKAARQALTELAGIPDTEMAQGVKTSWRDVNVAQVITQLQAAREDAGIEAAGFGLQRTKVRYVEATE
jgi:hypothetical protein